MFGTGNTHRRVGRGPLAADWGVKLRQADFFTGIGGFSLGFEFAGIETDLMCENDDNAMKVLETHWPHVRKFDDITTFDGRPERGRIDIVTGGFPCFPAGTQILTADGFRDIAEVAVGEQVLTHAGNWKPVLATMTRDDAPLLELTDADGTRIVTTPEHPFYVYDGERFGWVEAKDMLGKSWSRPQLAAAAPGPPEIEKSGVADLLGIILGLGWHADEAASETDGLERDLVAVLATFTYDAPPPWFLSLPHDLAKRVVEGFLMTAVDGDLDEGGRLQTRAFPPSCLPLLVSLRELAIRAALPYRASLTRGEESCRLSFELRSDPDHAVAVDPESGLCYLVTPVVSIESLSSATVHNLEVKDDNSYIADGVAVHNCQDLSVAGSERRGLAGERSGLFRELVRVVHEIQPKYVVWENVPGLFTSWSGSPDGADADGEWEGQSDILTVMGAFEDIGFSGGYRVLDSRFFGVPQSRRRVIGVVSRGRAGWRRAAAVLLEDPERGDAATAGGEEVQGCLAGASHCLVARGGYKADFSREPYIVEGEPPADFDRDARWVVGGAIEGVEIARSGREVLLGVAIAGSSPDAAGEGAAAGLPGWVDVGPKALDARREKQLGNAVTVNVAEFIGHRIVQLERFLRIHPWLDPNDD